MIVWANNDRLLHHIVLDDGTDVGDIAPGEWSKGLPLASPTAGYHCTLHYYPPYYIRSAHR